VTAPGRNDPYALLVDRFRRIALIGEAAGMLQWDMAAIMPPGGAESRAEQLAVLRQTAHGLRTDPVVADWIEAAAALDLPADAAANLDLMRREAVRARALPGDLVAALSRAGSACEMAWRRARPADDYAAVLPLLGEVVRLAREEAAAFAAALDLDPYDALLDGYEPGLTTATVDRLFGALAGFLPDLLDCILARQDERPAPLPIPGPFPVAAQRALGVRLMEAAGFDFDHGRLDTSDHPFCGGTPDDVRITTRYDEADFTRSLMGVLHETGHALYERGLPASWRHQPLGEARGMAVHESQSLILEMQAGRGRAFVGWLAPLAREAFGGTGPAWEADNLHRVYTRVARSLIRVDADEVTYPLHVVLRYRIERAILAGDLALADLPGAWRDAMRDLVGRAPPDDRDGCLQDVHWYDGAFGYFPTYTLGALIAAQLYAAAVAARPEIPDALGRGDFAPLVGWLRANVHAHGARLAMPDLVERATGAPLGVDAFRRHLEARYLA